MNDLRCKLRHLWGHKVDVRGKEYLVSNGGLLSDVEDAHAEILLQNDAFSSVGDAPSPSFPTNKNADERARLLLKTPRELLEVARDLGLSVFGKNQQMAVEAILAKRAEQDAARAEEDAERAKVPELAESQPDASKLDEQAGSDVQEKGDSNATEQE